MSNYSGVLEGLRFTQRHLAILRITGRSHRISTRRRKRIVARRRHGIAARSRLLPIGSALVTVPTMPITSRNHLRGWNFSQNWLRDCSHSRRK